MFLQLVVTGIAQGSIYALVALGMTILIRATGIVNFAHGEMFMLGAFLVYMLLNTAHIAILPAALISVVLMLVLGMAVERGLVRPLRDAPHMTIAMMTVAMSYLFRGIARAYWGADVLPLPPMLALDPIEVAGVIITSQELLIVVMTLLLVTLFFVFFHRTKAGRIAQAVSYSPRGAGLVGINVPAVRRSLWGASAMIGAIAGILVAPATLLYPEMGGQVLIRAFAAITLGGFGHLGGAVVGGLLIGVMEQLAGGYISTAMINITSYIVVIVVLLIRPAGLFGRANAARV